MITYIYICNNDIIFPKIIKNYHFSTCCNLLSQFLTVFVDILDFKLLIQIRKSCSFC